MSFDSLTFRTVIELLIGVGWSTFERVKKSTISKKRARCTKQGYVSITDFIRDATLTLKDIQESKDSHIFNLQIVSQILIFTS